MEIPSEIFGFVDVEAQDFVLVKLPHDNVCCLALTTGEDEDHGGRSYYLLLRMKTSLGDDSQAPRLVGLPNLDQPKVEASSMVQFWPTKLCVPVVIVAMLPLLAGVRPAMSVAMSFGVIVVSP